MRCFGPRLAGFAGFAGSLSCSDLAIASSHEQSLSEASEAADAAVGVVVPWAVVTSVVSTAAEPEETIPGAVEPAEATTDAVATSAACNRRCNSASRPTISAISSASSASAHAMTSCASEQRHTQRQGGEGTGGATGEWGAARADGRRRANGCSPHQHTCNATSSTSIGCAGALPFECTSISIGAKEEEAALPEPSA